MILRLLDSNILIDFFKKKERATTLVNTYLKEGPVVTSALCVAELRMGWNDEEAAFYLPRFYKLFGIEPITKEIAELAGALRRESQRTGRTLPTIDTLIAATALHLDATLITNNVKDFPIPSLKLAPLV